MRELNKQDMIDLLYGCAVLGTGGGGPLADGLALLEEHFEKGKTLKLITLDELPDDEYVVTPYGCGAPSAKPTRLSLTTAIALTISSALRSSATF